MKKYSSYEKDVMLAIRKAAHKRGNFMSFDKAIEVYEEAKSTIKNSWMFAMWCKKQIRDSKTSVYTIGNITRN